MANPQPDEFTRISNELYTAIMQRDFSKRQRKIIDMIIRMSYGCGKKYAILRYIDFELVGVNKSDIKKEIESLKTERVLSIEDECFALNKDYEQWGVPLVKGSSPNRWAQVLKRNLDLVGKIPTVVGETPTSENGVVGKTPTEVGKIPTFNETPVGKIPTIDQPEVGKIPTQVGEIPTEVGKTPTTDEGVLVGKTPTVQPPNPNSDAENGGRKEKDLKELKDLKKAAAAVSNDQEPDHKLLELEQLAIQVLARPIPTANDVTAMRQMLIASGGNVALIRKKVLEMARNYKPRTPGAAIKTFSYFLPGVLEEVERIKARAEPLVIPDPVGQLSDQERHESDLLTQEILGLLQERGISV